MVLFNIEKSADYFHHKSFALRNVQKLRKGKKYVRAKCDVFKFESQKILRYTAIKQRQPANIQLESDNDITRTINQLSK